MTTPRTEGAAPSADELAIIRLINRWMVLRDTGDWVRLRPVWHEDGRMAASWRHGTADEFIAANMANWDKLSIFHELGAIAVEIRGDRAVSQTKMTITQRGDLDGTLCDVTCMSRHLDRWEKRGGLWGLVLRQTIYDRDRLDPVTPGQAIALDFDLLNSLPERYRHLGYMQTKAGYEVRKDLPSFKADTGDAVLAEASAWLEEG